MKDNKIDIMCKKIGDIITELNKAEGNFRLIGDTQEGLRQLQYDLELLRKCTLDNPNFKWDKNISNGYTEAKVNAFRND